MEKLLWKGKGTEPNVGQDKGRLADQKERENSKRREAMRAYMERKKERA